ncbi:MAG: DNA double-strand break repair nuclease NurA [Cyanobacteria bacterium P01_E01_bin.6]
MTLKPSQIQAILDAKREDFQSFNKKALNHLEKYRAALDQLSTWPLEKIQKKLRRCSGECGAIALEPLEHHENCVIASRFDWGNREQSLAWVRQKLMNITTFAVDGSQIFPGKDLSLPVALVQIGWFENPHLEVGTYEKDIEVDVMTPSDLQVSSSGEPADRRVNFRRFEMEINRLVRYIEEHKNQQDCLVFFDGSLVGTFADAFDGDLRRQYVDCFLKLLNASQTYQVPLVGFVDTTYARDLTVMLQHLFQLPECPAIHDAQLLHTFMEWGDRTPIFQCDRSGILKEYGEQHNQIAFTYLKTTRHSFPARVEMPMWLYQSGLANRVMDWVRGEVIIGGGYPYVIETADQTAVLQSMDRQAFFKLLQDWAEKEDIKLRLSRKMVSKTRRR